MKIKLISKIIGMTDAEMLKQYVKAPLLQRFFFLSVREDRPRTAARNSTKSLYQNQRAKIDEAVSTCRSPCHSFTLRFSFHATYTKSLITASSWDT